MPDVEFGGLSFVATPRANKAPQPDTLILLVDSGSSDHYFDGTIIPELASRAQHRDAGDYARDLYGCQLYIVRHDDWRSTRHRRRQGQETAQRADSRCDRSRYGTPPLLL